MKSSRALGLAFLLMLACVRERAAGGPAYTTTTTTTTVDGVAPAPETPRGPGLVVDTMNREAVRAFFAQHYVPSEGVPSEWNGNVDLRIAGTTSAAFKSAILARMNYFRAMAGVPADIVLGDAECQKDQQAALMMSAQNALSHHPDTSWAAYTPEGAEAAGKSNLYLGVRGPAAVSGYIRDLGANNAAVGHRRWLLYPQTRVMGTGDVEAGNGHPAANALWVSQPSTYLHSRPAIRDGFVAWPPRGWVPYQVIYQRWSLSYPKAIFDAASVEMTRDGKTIPLHVPPNVSTGFGENTIIWELPGFIGPDNVMIKPTTDMTVHITIRNVQIEGAVREFSYDVVAFDPGMVVPPPPPAPPPAEWPSNTKTPWGEVPTLKPIPMPTNIPSTMPSTMPTTVPPLPTTWPFPPPT